MISSKTVLLRTIARKLRRGGTAAECMALLTRSHPHATGEQRQSLIEEAQEFNRKRAERKGQS